MQWLISSIFFFSASIYADSATQNNDSQPDKSPIDAVSNEPKSISTPAAPYPRKLLRNCVGGKVTFQFSVMPNGKVSPEVKIIESPHKLLSLAVVATVTNKWQFTPYAVGDSGKLATYQAGMSFDPLC